VIIARYPRSPWHYKALVQRQDFYDVRVYLVVLQ
jgi:hypothetical protein